MMPSRHAAVSSGCARLVVIFSLSCSWCRPVNRTLLAKKTSIPQAVCSGIAAALHLPIVWLIIFHFHLGYLGSAYAYVISSANTTALVYAWVYFTGRGPGIWGAKPTRDALKATSFHVHAHAALLLCPLKFGMQILPSMFGEQLPCMTGAKKTSRAVRGFRDLRVEFSNYHRRLSMCGSLESLWDIVQRYSTIRDS